MIPLHWLDYHAEYRLKTHYPVWQPCATSRESYRSLWQLDSTPFVTYFGNPPPTPNRELKGRLEDHLLLFKRGPNILVIFFPLRFWFKYPISASVGGWTYNGSFTLVHLGHLPTFVMDGHCHCFKLPDRIMKRSVKSTHFLSLVQCLSLDISFFSFRNSVSVFLFLFLSLLWMDGCLWMHMDIVRLGLDFRDKLECDQVFRLELVLGDGTRVVFFFLETCAVFS